MELLSQVVLFPHHLAHLTPKSEPGGSIYASPGAVRGVLRPGKVCERPEMKVEVPEGMQGPEEARRKEDREVEGRRRTRRRAGGDCGGIEEKRRVRERPAAP